MKLVERNYRWTTEVIYRDPENGEVHAACWFSTAHQRTDEFRYKLAVTGFFSLLGWEMVSYQIRRLPEAGAFVVGPLAR